MRWECSVCGEALAERPEGVCPECGTATCFVALDEPIEIGELTEHWVVAGGAERAAPALSRSAEA